MKSPVKRLLLRSQRTLDLEYQDGGDELQNLITEITEMRDPGLFISVGGRQWKLGGNKWWKNVTVLDHFRLLVPGFSRSNFVLLFSSQYSSSVTLIFIQFIHTIAHDSFMIHPPSRRRRRHRPQIILCK